LCVGGGLVSHGLRSVGVSLFLNRSTDSGKEVCIQLLVSEPGKTGSLRYATHKLFAAGLLQDFTEYGIV
jgi:hypothetical protein